MIRFMTHLGVLEKTDHFRLRVILGVVKLLTPKLLAVDFTRHSPQFKFSDSLFIL